MPLPSLAAIPRMSAELTRYELTDPNLPGQVIPIWLRPLLGAEKDIVEEAMKAFVARYVTGGFVHPTTNEWHDKPEPILDLEGKVIPVSLGLARMMHRYEAMQKPMPGHQKPAGWELVPVSYMVDMTVRTDVAWEMLQQAAAMEWAKGNSGEAWGRPVSSEKPPSGSSDTDCPTPNPSSTSAPESTISAAPSA